jgi:hypothetical protein
MLQRTRHVVVIVDEEPLPPLSAFLLISLIQSSIWLKLEMVGACLEFHSIESLL